MSDLYQRIAFLSPEKRQLLLQQLNKKKENVFLQAQIRPCSRESNSFPLSFAQQRLWFLAQLEPDSPLYNISDAIRLQGQLNLAALEQSFNEILRRHEVLRTNFKTVEGQPVAVVSSVKPQLLSIIDLKELPSAQREIKVRQLVQAEAQQPFDLENDTLLRVKLLRLDQQEYVTLLSMHHIVSDAWSIDVLLRELVTLYQAFCSGQPSPLAELPIQYIDFAAWQRQWLTGEILESQLSYWRQQLEGAPPVLELPSDRPRRAVQSFQGASHSFELSLELSVALKTLSQQEGSTLFMTLLAAFKTLLHHYTGSSDIVVGSPIANRNHSEIEGLIGFFVNTLVLRTNLGANPSFRELLRQVREIALGAYAHQDVPFEQLVEKLQPRRDLSHTPLFQVMFGLQNTQRSEIELPGLILSSLQSDSGTAKFDLGLEIIETTSGLTGIFEYNTDLFEANTIRRMAEHFQTLLAGIIANPEERLSKLPLLTKAEQNQLLVEWNDTKVEYRQNKCIHQLFEATVECTPDAIALIARSAIALVFEEQQLTYRELNQRANQLAHYLQKLGIQPEMPVAICVERSLEMVIGLLGILKAGGAYVPIDPSYPQQRLAYILSNSQVPVLLTQKKLVPKLPEHDAHVVCLDTEWEVISLESTLNPLSVTRPENLAYVIYTSGSTGTPKGVMIQHQSVVNFIQTAIDKYGLREGDRVLQFASISFDVAAEEIYPCLSCGGTLILCTDEMLGSGQTFVQKCRDLKLTVLDLPTAYWQQLVSDIATADLVVPESLRLVIIGGEQALAKQVETWQSCVGDRQQLINAYGPTEATVETTIYKLPKLASTDKASQRLPIGRPIHNVQVYILDKYLQQVPIGVVGELYISGAGLARGYLNRPDLTAEKIIPNHLGNEPGARLYKTGDLVRYLQDGNIEFLGRIDNQVKVRGFRIELGELEAVINQHPAIQENVVVVREDEPGDKRIVAYLVTKQQAALSVSDLRSFLNKKLPEYMMPSVFMQIAALPLTPNVKVDKRALPLPNITRSELDKEFVPPQTPIEIKLAEIWSEILHVEQVGIYDNFFELGGDSILTIQIIAKANQAGIQLTPKQLFQHQNIAELAAACLTTITTTAEQGLVTGAVPLAPIQQWFFEENFLQPHHYNQTVLLEVRQALDLKLLKQAVQHLLIHHDALRLKFEKTKFGWQQFHAQTDDTISFSLVDLSTLPAEEQKLALEATASELQASLNLTQAPLIRVALFNFGAEKNNRLLLVIHHLVIDGVSWRILIEDLETVYKQLIRKEAIKLPSKTTSFKEWSKKISKYANSQTAQQELDYWLTKPWKKAASLPVDYPGGSNTVASACLVSVKLSVEETTLLLQEVPATYRTQINDVLLTALVQAFAQWTGEDLLLINLEGHGREDIFEDVDLSRTVGWFTSVFPVILDLREISSPGEALKAVKEQLRAIPNRGVGYSILRYLSENIETIKSLRTLPQPEILFNYLGQFDQSFSESSLFDLAKESCGSTYSLQDKRNELLDINAFVVNGQLQVDWTYSHDNHRQSTIEALAEGFIIALRSLIAHCKSKEAGGYTPSDFPLAKLNQRKLDELLQKEPQIEDIYPLSPMQQGILFQTLYTPTSEAYFAQTSCTLRGKLNLSAFKQAWQKVFERHSILRTAFFWEGLDTPLQVVLKNVNLPYQLQDWRELAPSDQQARLEILLQTDRSQGFDLSSAPLPLMRLMLIHLSNDTFELIWSSHHLLLDGWSTPLLLQEVFVLYQAFCHNHSPNLEKSRPYRDYIAWLMQQNLAEAKTFWRQVLKGFTTPTPLGIDKFSQKLSNEKEAYEEQEFKLPATISTSLKTFAKQHQITLNTLLQATWAILLSKYSDKEDVIFGATISSRPPVITGVESMVGLFINTLPVRVQVCHHQHLIPWLQELQSQQIETRQYEYSPLVQIQKWSEVPQGVALFESVMVFENYPDNSSLKDNLELEISNTRGVIRNHYPLTIRVLPSSELSLVIMYDCCRFDAATIDRIFSHFEILLTQFLKQHDITLKELINLFTEAEREQQVIKEKELENVSLQKFKLTKRKAIRPSS